MWWLCASAPFVQDQQQIAPSWEQKINDEVNQILKSHNALNVDGKLEGQSHAEVDWTIASQLPETNERPRPPLLESTISNLRTLMDHIELENVNAVAVQDATSSSYASKKALIESMLAVPQQAVIARGEQRGLCEREVKALLKLEGIVGEAINRGDTITKMRGDQAAHYTQMTSTIKSLTQKNIETLDEVLSLLGDELVAEVTNNGGVHFDPVALRLRAPEDMIKHAQELTSNLVTLMHSKLNHHDQALEQIKKAFGCADCEQAAAKLKDATSTIKNDLKAAKEKCAFLAESHRALDESDREKVLALKKDLEDIETAERVHQAAEAALQQERKQAQHAAEKMLGLFNTVTPSSKSQPIA